MNQEGACIVDARRASGWCHEPKVGTNGSPETSSSETDRRGKATASRAGRPGNVPSMPPMGSLSMPRL